MSVFEGLIDEGETAEKAAIRELEEETGFKADEVLESSSLLATDPGSSESTSCTQCSVYLYHFVFEGMTTANMKLVALGVTFPDKLELSDAKLDEGEHIVKRIVSLSNLYETLQGLSIAIYMNGEIPNSPITMIEYAEKVLTQFLHSLRFCSPYNRTLLLMLVCLTSQLVYDGQRR